jgi:hypothetical protein
MKANRNAARIALLLLATAVPGASRGESALRVLSNRPDLISAGDVLIEVVLPPATPPGSVVLLDDGQPAQATIGTDANGRFLARVTGLALGANTLTARGRAARRAPWS